MIVEFYSESLATLLVLSSSVNTSRLKCISRKQQFSSCFFAPLEDQARLSQSSRSFRANHDYFYQSFFPDEVSGSLRCNHRFMLRRHSCKLLIFRQCELSWRHIHIGPLDKYNFGICFSAEDRKCDIGRSFVYRFNFLPAPIRVCRILLRESKIWVSNVRVTHSSGYK